MNNTTESDIAPTLYRELLAAGVPLSHHQSDLYFPVTQQTTAILAKHPLQQSNATRFICQITGKSHYDVPFGYEPYWLERISPRE